MHRFLLSANLLLALMLVPSSRADVLYTYSAPVWASGSYDAHSWSFIEPGFLTSDTTVNASNLHSGGTLHSSVGLATITLTAVSIHSPSSMNFVVQENAAGYGAQTAFSDGPLNHYGTYQVIAYKDLETGSPVYDTLVLSPVTSSAPEPASLPLLAGGTLIAIIGVLRGKLRG